MSIKPDRILFVFSDVIYEMVAGGSIRNCELYNLGVCRGCAYDDKLPLACSYAAKAMEINQGWHLEEILNE